MEKQTFHADHSHLVLTNPAGLYDASRNGYSHLAMVASGIRTVYVAGQGGEDESGKLPDDFRAQVRQAFLNLRTALSAAGAGVDDIAKLTVLIVDHNEERLHIFGEELTAALGNGPKPACTLVPVPRLALDGMQFEVEAVAACAD